MDADTTVTDRHHILPDGGFVRDTGGGVADEATDGRSGWNGGAHPDLDRGIPAFTGPTPGPTGADGTNSKSTAGETLKAALPDEYVQLLYDDAVANKDLHEASDDFKPNCVDRSWYRKVKGVQTFFMKPWHFRLYIIVNLMIALVDNPQVSLDYIFSRDELLGNTYIRKTMTGDQFQWFQRYGYHPDLGDGAATEAGDRDHDRYRYCRKAVKILLKWNRLSWNLHQHITMDEIIKNGKHLSDQRIKMGKPNVHSGHVVHAVNDTAWGYTWWMEEEHWRKDQSKSSLYRRSMKRLKFRHHVLWRDRGYAMPNDEEDMHWNWWIHPAGTTKETRKDLPKAELTKLKKEMPEFHFSVMYKGATEVMVLREHKKKKCCLFTSQVHSANFGVSGVRGQKKSSTVVEYIGPELPLDYSNWGRGGTDLGDQIMKLAMMHVRKIKRQPIKDHKFYEDKAINNKFIIFKFRNAAVKSRGQCAWTQVEFLVAGIHELCDNTTSRQRALPDFKSRQRPRYWWEPARRTNHVSHLSSETTTVCSSSDAAQAEPSESDDDDGQQPPRMPSPSGAPSPRTNDTSRKHSPQLYEKTAGLLIPGREPPSENAKCRCHGPSATRTCTQGKNGTKKQTQYWCSGCQPAAAYCMDCFFERHKCTLK